MAGLEIKMTIEGTHPPIWRQVIVPDKISLADFHEVVIASFGFSDDMMYEVKVPRESSYTIHGPDKDAHSYRKHDRKSADLNPFEPYFDDYNWIRYSYDKGRIKVKVECKYEIDGYDSRSARLIKAKGGNPVEGVAEVLDSMDFPESEHEYVPSGLKMFSRLADSFWQLMEKSGIKDPEPLEVDYEPEYDTVVSTAGLSILTLMDKLSDKNIRDFIKYLQLGYIDEEERGKSIQRIHDFLRDNPKYYLYPIDEETLEMLGRLVDGNLDKGGTLDENMLGLFEVLGLLMCQTNDKHRQNVITLSSETSELFKQIKTLPTDSIYKKMKIMDRRIRNIIMAYGVIDTDKLCELYKGYYDASEEDIEIMRFLHWHGRLRGEVNTFETYDPKTYHVASPDFTMQELEDIILYRRDHLPDGMGYNSFPKDVIDAWEGGITAIYNPWYELDWFLREMSDWSHDEIAYFIEDEFLKVFAGAEAYEVVSDICVTFEFHDCFSRVQVWLLTMGAVSDTGLPHLKAYSRKEFRDMTGEYPDGLPIIAPPPQVLSKKKGKDTPIYDFPVDKQLKIYELFDGENYINNPWKAVSPMRGIVEEYPDNLDVLALAAVRYMECGKKKDSLEIVDRIQELDPRQHGLRDLFRSYGSTNNNNVVDFNDYAGFGSNYDYASYDDDKVIQMPIKREHPKIQPNDPCPCGSGKKFKKCCRGKGIYD